jgi:putative FmdB family regulatory protein
MPIYEYQCTFCNSQEEVLQKVTDPAPESCSACGEKMGMQKVMSHTSFSLKGGGWYKDLYASSKPSCEKTGCGTDKASCQQAS